MSVFVFVCIVFVAVVLYIFLFVFVCFPHEILLYFYIIGPVYNIFFSVQDTRPAIIPYKVVKHANCHKFIQSSYLSSSSGLSSQDAQEQMRARG